VKKVISITLILAILLMIVAYVANQDVVETPLEEVEVHETEVLVQGQDHKDDENNISVEESSDLIVRAAPQGVHTTLPALWLNLETPWDEENFADVAVPLYLSDDTPYGALAIQHIQYMNDNLYGRKPFSYREKEAATWLVETLLAMGHPWENICVQEFPVDHQGRWNTLMNSSGFRSDFAFRYTTQLSQNIVLTIPGQSERKIIVGAHYDSYPTPGASDNASGVGLLLESAQRMQYVDHYYTIVYVFFGAEEVGLQGSLYFADNLTEEQSDQIVMMINADVLFEGPYLFYSATYNDNYQAGSNALTRQVDDIADSLDLGLIPYPEVAFVVSTDHQPFLMRGYTIVNLMGLYRVNYPHVVGIFRMGEDVFLGRVLHSQNDCFHIIEERWPGKIETNMNVFSIFLEEMLLMDSD